jgi:putative SOS response-associated peptidase YedK
MCGRFTYRLTWRKIVTLYRLTLDAPARNTQPRYNICPTTLIDPVIENDRKRALVPMRWGLVPSWGPTGLDSERLRSAPRTSRAGTGYGRKVRHGPSQGWREPVAREEQMLDVRRREFI